MKIEGGRSVLLFRGLVALLLLYMKPALGRDECIERERQALLKFKQGLIDDYGRLDSWGSEDNKRDCCKWRGVHCSNRTGHVIMLDLRGPWFNSNFGSKPLKGMLSPCLLQLQHLNYLDLSYNEFGASHIPEFFGSLSKLRYLNLSYAEFGGEIPRQLGNLSNLWSLDISGSTAFYYDVKNLDWLSSLHSLRHLDLSGVFLGEVVDWVEVISKLPHLVTLRLHESKFPNIIPSALPSINRSTSLVVIDISTNSLTSSIYYWLFNCSSSLTDINLAGNELEGVIPDAFGKILSLENLDLSLNQLEGGIPKSFGNLGNLRSLDLSSNKFSESLPKFLQNLYGHAENSLEILRENQLSGSLPDITKFSFLRELYVEYNQLNGSFPESFGQLSRLEVLVLYRNQMRGSLPDLTPLPSLRKLNLFENQLTGIIPSSLGRLSHLEFLDASSNFLEGVISEVHLSNLSKLQYLDLSFNSLSLDFSSEWVPPFQLGVVRLAYCKLGPHFPNWLQNQNNFTELDISSAGISDTTPNWFWDLPPRLQYLNLSYNQINGLLPNLSFEFTDVTNIDLCTNLFEGPIPVFPPNVSSLNLSKNKFSGTVTLVCAINGGDLTYLDLSDNQLSGNLPDCWMHLDGLVVLNLANE
ncbi:receptor-like protein EIX1 [Diospyros lotus]|uniref:receptor-like protein EIX1 n=1 Tax=Diospyros lotus TaxID=55363 RepID=UPI002254A7CB|nr:receptor-like protein EIX1 [Diospyros lotus]